MMLQMRLPILLLEKYLNNVIICVMLLVYRL